MQEETKTDIVENTWKISPLTPFGLELIADLSQSLSVSAKARLVELVDEFGIVVVRNQCLTLNQQRQILESLGRIEQVDLEYVSLDDGVLNNDAMAYHSDFAYAHTPYKYLSLHAVDLVAGESCTRFANGALAYQRLPAEKRKLLASLTTTAVSADISKRTIGYDEWPPEAAAAVRGAGVFHHRTSHPILYVNEGQHARFNELDRATSDALMADLFAVLYAPAAILTHDWAPGDILIWDNLALQHGRPGLQALTRRHLQRAAVADVGGADMLPGYFNNL